MVVQIPEDDTGPIFKGRALRDREDLQLELGRQNAGRQIRFFAGENSPRAIEERKKEAERRFTSLLEILLRDDPRYAGLYAEVNEKLGKARKAVDLALLDITQREEAAARELQRVRDNAGTLSDGTRVYRSSSENGIYREDGQRLSVNEASTASVPAGAPSWEAYQAAQAERDRQAKDRTDTMRYRDEVLQKAERRLKDAERPPSMDDLQELGQHLDSQMPGAVQRQFRNNVNGASTALSAAHTMAGETELNVPDLRDSFDTVRIGGIPSQHHAAGGPSVTTRPR